MDDLSPAAQAYLARLESWATTTPPKRLSANHPAWWTAERRRKAVEYGFRAIRRPEELVGVEA